MSHVMVMPQLIEATATDLAAIGTTLEAAHLDAAAPTLAIAPAAADEVSAGIAQLFSRHGADYQKAAGAAAAYHDEFVQHLTKSAASYAGAEAANAAALQPLTALGESFGAAFLAQATELFVGFNNLVQTVAYTAAAIVLIPFLSLGGIILLLLILGIVYLEPDLLRAFSAFNTGLPV